LADFLLHLASKLLFLARFREFLVIGDFPNLLFHLALQFVDLAVDLVFRTWFRSYFLLSIRILRSFSRTGLIRSTGGQPKEDACRPPRVLAPSVDRPPVGTSIPSQASPDQLCLAPDRSEPELFSTCEWGGGARR